MTRKTVGIFGSYAARPDEPLYREAYALGRALGSAGFTVLNGGYDGVMRASSQGAKQAGACTIGVTCPTVLKKRGTLLLPNEFLDEIHEAPTMLTRIEAMMRACGAYVFFEGGTGTLSELGVIWEYVNKGFIRARPVVLVGDYWADLVTRIARGRPGADEHVFPVRSADDVVPVIAERAVGTHARSHLRRLASRDGPGALFADVQLD